MTIDLRYPLFGLALGLAIQQCGAADRDRVLRTAACKSKSGARIVLCGLGIGMILTALLCWLAVIDVDLLRIVPLTGTLLCSALLFGAGVGLCGATPFTLLGGLGAGRFTESLCGVAGCAVGAWLGSYLPQGIDVPLFSPVEGTLFRLTLTDPFLLGGSFASLACTGAVLWVISLFLRIVPAPLPSEPEATHDAPVVADPPDDDPLPASESAIPPETPDGAQEHPDTIPQEPPEPPTPIPPSDEPGDDDPDSGHDPQLD